MISILDVDDEDLFLDPGNGFLERTEVIEIALRMRNVLP
ncbi:MAG: hypothetical protein BWY45_01331 [Euryarchaeota archaeon ADurb.Bin294]|jgi:hypothetical protein|nr:MAG: hypothetical protein BWY45_01331 [Euryarchaeota archaeon ADurb.Bin294]